MSVENNKEESFEDWFREYMTACINHFNVTGDSVSGEREIKDVSKKVEELLKQHREAERQKEKEKIGRNVIKVVIGANSNEKKVKDIIEMFNIVGG